MTPTRVARSSSPMVAPAIQEISPEQLFQKQLVSRGLSFNRRLVNIDISVLQKLYPALQSTKMKPAQDASLINSYLSEKATISKRVVEMLHQHYKVQKRRAAINDERNVERLFM